MYFYSMTEQEFKEMSDYFAEERRKIKASKEYADKVLTEANIKHLLVPKGTYKGE
jgi:hypothetical protein